MGIRFRCPNGHKIHVKAYLAGKRGICPECGLKVPIPPQSDPEFADKAQKKRAVQAHPQPGTASGTVRRSVGVTAPRPEGEIGRIKNPFDDASPSSEESKAADHPNQPFEASRASTVDDPITAAPQAKWFVRPPSGGQFGPAPGNVLREWMSQGRVTPDSYVWREGWPEWQVAGKVFRGLDSPNPVTGGESIPTIVSQAIPKSTSELYRRRKSNRITFTVVGLLGLACAVLFAALVYVVRFMK